MPAEFRKAPTAHTSPDAGTATLNSGLSPAPLTAAVPNAHPVLVSSATSGWSGVAVVLSARQWPTAHVLPGPPSTRPTNSLSPAPKLTPACFVQLVPSQRCVVPILTWLVAYPTAHASVALDAGT